MKNKLVLLCVISILGASGCASSDKVAGSTKTQKQANADCAPTTGSRLKRTC
jgi:outer membrane lipoprotein SlyB